MDASRSKILLIVILSMFSGLGSFAQKPDFTSGLSLSVNPGILSFHGDLTASNNNPLAIIRYNSKFGFSLAAQKEFNHLVGVKAQYTAGNLYSIHSEENQYFTGSISEFNVSALFTPLGFFPDLKNRFNLKPYVSAGLGSFGFRSCKRYIDTDDIYPPCYGYENDGITRTARKNSLAIPLGLGISVPINQNLAVVLDYTYRITNTDLLDATIGSTSRNDSYSHTSLGLRFTIQSPEPMKPKLPDPVINEPAVRDNQKAVVAPLNMFIESIINDVVSSGDAFSVNLRINKGHYTGPAKLAQRFPEGFNALEASSTNGRFSFSNRTVLIEWDNMPGDSIINYTYYVRLASNVAGSQTITGRFEYEENDKWNTVRFNNYIFADNKIEEGDEILRKQEEEQANMELEKANQEKAISEAKVEKQEKAKVEKQEQLVNFDPLILKDPADDVEFRIQCGAFKDSNQGGKRLVERYGITEDMREVLENGWYKYTVGSFNSYVDAVNFKNSFIKRTKLYTAFIVAYKNGKRIYNINDAFK